MLGLSTEVGPFAHVAGMPIVNLQPEYENYMGCFNPVSKCV